MTGDRVYCDVPGTYAVREAKGAVEVACRVEHGPARDPDTGETLDRSWHWTVTINGRVAHCSPGIYPRLLIGRAISDSEYQFLLADREWAKQHAPNSPEANPRRAIVLADIPIPFL